MKRELNTPAERSGATAIAAEGSPQLPLYAWIPCLVLVLALLLPGHAEAQTPIEDFQYAIEDGAVTLLDYTGQATAVVVPAEIEGLPLTTIGNWAFTRNETLQSVELPQSVTRIGMEAFSYCRNLEELRLGNALNRIESYAFFGCSSLESILLPETLTELGPYAFSGCLQLREISLPSGLSRLENGVFYGCSRLESVELPTGLTFIGKETFGRCSLLSQIEIGPALESIDSSAFAYCVGLSSFDIHPENPYYGSQEGSLCNKEQTQLFICPAGKVGTFTLPPNIVDFLPNAFQGCIHLTDFEVHPEHTLYKSRDGVLYNHAGDTLLVFPAGRTGQCTIAEGTTTLASLSFSDSSLLSLILPASLAKIEERAFWYCSALLGIGFEGDAPETGTDIFYDVPSTLAVYYKSGANGWGDEFAGYPARSDAQNQTITLTPVSQPLTYGDADQQLWASSSSALVVTLLTSPEEIATVTSSKMLRIKAAGTFTITGYQPGGTRRNVNYFPAEPASMTLEVLPKAATVKVDSLELPSNYPLPFFSFSVEGLVKDDTLEGPALYYIDGIPIDELLTPLPEGTYELSADGLFHPNYTFSYQPATLTILPPSEFEYTLSEGEITIIAYHGAASSLTIPGSISGYPVLWIAEEAFLGHDELKTVTFPETLRGIGSRAFAHCSLNEIVIPDNVRSIGESAFLNCPARMVRLGSGLSNLGLDALIGSYRVEVSQENMSYSSRDGVLFNKEQTVLHFCPLGKAGFYPVPSGVQRIAPRAFFSQKSLMKIDLPFSVLEIGPWAFGNCSSLQRVILPNENTVLGEALFYQCSNLLEFIVPAKLKEIPWYAFYGCTQLQNLELPAGLLKISEGAFYGCSSLSEINFPSTLTTLERWAFRATGLTRVYIPASVTGNLEDGVFRDCLALMEFKVNSANQHYCSLPPGILTDSTYVLFDSTGSTLIQYPAGRAGGYTAPPTLTRVHDHAFSGAAGLTQITFPESLTLLGEELFSGCDQLEKVYFRGDAPEWTGRNPFEETQATLYYLYGTKGWTNPWGGRPTQVWSDEWVPSLTFSEIERDDTGKVIAFTITYTGVLESSSDMVNWESVSEEFSGSYRVVVEPGKSLFFRVGVAALPLPTMKLGDIEKDEGGKVVAFTLNYEGVLEMSSDKIHWEQATEELSGSYRVVVEPQRQLFFRVASAAPLH